MSSDGRRYFFQYDGGLAEAQDTGVKEGSEAETFEHIECKQNDYLKITLQIYRLPFFFERKKDFLYFISTDKEYLVN